MLVEAFNYKCWAVQRTLDAARQVDSQAFPATLPFVRQQLNHMVIVEDLFRARLQDDPAPHAATNSDVVPSLEALQERIGRSDQWFSDYAGGLDPDRFNDVLTFRFADGQHGAMSRLEMLFHIINHGTYHRGAIGHALDLAKVAHPADTYTVFIHQQQPERRTRR